MQIISHLSKNQKFIFETEKECDYYNELYNNQPNKPFFVSGTYTFVLLDCCENEDKNQIIAWIQESDCYLGNTESHRRHKLWHITYDKMRSSISMGFKNSLYDYLYIGNCENAIVTNYAGWYPNWQYYKLFPYANNYTKEQFLEHIKEELKKYCK